MNYIKKLEKKIEIYEQGIDEIKRYLALDKFRWPENHVNVNDIHLRLREYIENPIADVEFES